MTRKKLALTTAAVAAVVAIGGGLTGLAAGPDGGPGTREGRRYSVSATGSGAVLLDTATGETWLLTQPKGGEPAWIPVRKPNRPTEPEKASPKQTEVRPAEPRPTPPALEAIGHLKLTRSFRLTPKIAGIVSRVHVRVGDAVKAGTLLVTLDDTDARLNVEAAETGLTLASAKLAPRTSPATVPESVIRQAEAEALRARVEVFRAKVALDATRLSAPADGTVVEINAAPGEAVGPGGPVMVVASLRDLEAVVQIPEADVGRVTIGKQGVVRVGAVGKEYVGEVTAVSAVIDPATATATVRVKVHVPPGKVAPLAGSFVTIRFVDK